MKILNNSKRKNIRVNMIEANEWTNHYRKLYFDSAIENDKEYISKPSGKGLDKLTIEELQQAMNGMKSRKAPGLNGINAELIKYGGTLLHLRILHFLNNIWMENKIPKEWRREQVYIA